MERTQKPKITRNRELRACTECRKRKLKCDRQHPCSACKRRDETTSCFFERRFEGQQSEQERRVRAEARLEHLEKLVQQLSQLDEGFVISQSLDDTSQGEVKQGRRDDALNRVISYGATHWSAMLEDIDELRDVLTEPDEMEAQDETEGSDMKLLFGSSKSLSLQQLLSQYLPSRIEADRLVAAYFRAKAVKAPFIHAAHFSRVYRVFWDNPAAASPLWTSTLFSVFHIATRTLSSTSGTDGDENRKPNRFATAAAHCLVAGEYHRPQPFAVEALTLFAQAKCLTSVNISHDLAMLFGTIIRLATLMGYHRDPDTSTQALSPFEGEMRRRTWSLCMQLDILVSFQLGIPSNVQFPTWDTKPPTNLLDSDFDEESVKLPPARPLSESTELVFYIVKHKLATIFEKILRHSLSTNKQPDVMELETISTELRTTYQDLPNVFKPRLVSDSVVDSPSVIVTRLCVNAIYQKCVCVLHRRHAILEREESIRVCYEAATDLVKRFVDVYREFEPGGQLETEKWFMGSITWHDFFLCCSTLCLVVCSIRNGRNSSIGSPGGVASVNQPSLELLSQAKSVLERCQPSMDTRKVRRLIDATILKFGTETNGNSFQPQNGFNTSNGTFSSTDWLVGQGENNWPWQESEMMMAEDPAWTYMQQFLDLPDGSDMMDA